ncbi:MAG: hypothetical protein WCF04_10920 [Candidatus Nanopelagicales bacterium]
MRTIATPAGSDRRTGPVGKQPKDPSVGTPQVPAPQPGPSLEAFLILGIALTVGMALTFYRDPGPFWAWGVSLAVYLGVGATSPQFRPGIRRMSAAIWVPWLGLMLLVLVPWAILAVGPTVGTLPSLPGWPAINAALLMSCMAYAALAVGVGGTPAPRSPRTARTALLDEKHLVVMLFALAYAGAVLKLMSQGGLHSYLAGDPVSAAAQSQDDASVLGVLGTFLPMLGPAAGMLAWRRWKCVLSLRLIPLLVLAILPVTTMSYNRAAWVFPLVISAVVVVRFHPRAALPLFAAGIILLPAGILAVGTFRDATQARYLGIEMVDAESTGPLGDLQVYGAAPQFVAFAVAADPDVPTLAQSILSPVPKLGTQFREESGVAAYNRSIYAEDVADQILPLSAEIYWLGGLPALLVGYFVVGLGIRAASRFAVRDPADPVRLFLGLQASLYLTLSLFWSAAVVAQLLIYAWFVPFITMRTLRVA